MARQKKIVFWLDCVKNGKFYQVGKKSYWFYYIIWIKQTVIVSVYFVKLGMILALAKSMPTWKIGAYNFFYMILKVGTILAYYPCQEFDS